MFLKRISSPSAVLTSLSRRDESIQKILKKKKLFLDVVVVLVGSGLVGRHGWLQSRRSSSRRLRWVLCVC